MAIPTPEPLHVSYFAKFYNHLLLCDDSQAFFVGQSQGNHPQKTTNKHKFDLNDGLCFEI